MNSSVNGRLIFAAPETCADLLYAAGFNAPDPVVWFRIPGKNALVVSILEFDRARSQARKNVEILPRESFFEKGAKDRSEGTLLLNLSRQFHVKQWTVPSDFPLLYADLLRKNGIGVVPVPVFWPRRECKTARELALLAKVMTKTQNAMIHARNILRASAIGKNGILRWNGKILTSDILREQIEGYLKAHGCTASDTITSHGTQCSQPHNVGSGPILAGETIVLDIFPRDDVSGYWGDMTRTYVKGEPLPIVRKAWKAVLDASRLAESMIRAGESASGIHIAAAECMQKAGFRTGRNADQVPCGFIHGLGHGVGLEIHESPRVSPANPGPLKIGNVISNEPGLYHPAWGGIRLEDVLAVTADGSRNFHSLGKDLNPDAD